MKSNLKHLIDILFVGTLYLAIIAFPTFVILNILGPCDLGSGLANLAAILFSVIFTIAIRIALREARFCHNKGKRFIFQD